MEELKFDTIIIGTGIAGLAAAYVTAQHGKTAVIAKSDLKEGSTMYAQGGIAVAMTEDDAPEFHLEDTLAAGAGLCNSEAVKILVDEAQIRVKELIQLGANFDKKDGDFDFTKEAAHSRRRILHARDATGREISKTLGQALINNPNITFFPNTMITELLLANNTCIGCVGMHNHKPITFFGKTTLITTGGCGQIYSKTTNPTVATGDGIALAFKAGAAVQDMEFIQFHPTTLAIGDKRPISIFLISEAVRGEGAVLRNIHGDRFMPTYHPDAELAPRDIVARAIYAESQKTKNHVFLDLEPIKHEAKERFPTIYARCKEAGIDITKDFIPVSPAAHYCMGGIKTDTWGKTSIQNLFAAGEAASLGLHGANRLASNSLLDGLVFGHRAGQMALESQAAPHTKLQQLIHSDTEFEKPQIHKLLAAKQAIRSLMWRKVSIVRNKTDLKEALYELESLSWLNNSKPNSELITEVQNMHCLATLTTKAALLREESRGAHYREDFPYSSETWVCHIVFKGDNVTKE